MEDSSQESFQGSQLPTLHKGCSYGFSLKCNLTWKEYNRKNTGDNPLYPSSYKPSYLSPQQTKTHGEHKIFWCILLQWPVNMP